MFATLLSSRLRRLRRFPFSWWLAVLGVALTVAFVVSTTVSRAAEAAARYGDVTTVYVTTHSLKPGDIITAGDVQQQSRPRSFTPTGARSTNPAGAVADSAIAANEVITNTNTGTSGLSPTAALLHDDEQAIAVAITDGTPTFQIGDHVSVISTPQVNDPSTSQPAIVVTDDARVVNVSDKAVTIAVSADNAPRVAFAEAKGAVTLAITTP
jgi:Flp pilus assembly protein CpaB